MRPAFIFDSGSLGQLATGDRRIEILLDRIRSLKGRAVVPSVVLAECCGDHRHDARYHRALNALGGVDDCVVPIDRRLALRAGGILRSSRMTETIDGIVVAVAEAFGPFANIVTNDTRHMLQLAASANVQLGIIDTTKNEPGRL